MPETKIHNNFPDFFIAGAPKCGTTSLYEWLKTHPRLYMPVKEPSFFSQDIRPLPYTTIPEYLEFFKNPPTPNCLIGEASPKHLYSSTGLREIARLNPSARIIVILRNPVDLVVSFHGQMLREGLEDQSDFRTAWELADKRRSGIAIPPDCAWPKMLDYPFWGAIGSRLSDLYAVFPATQVRVFTLEDLRSDPRAAYQSILGFLGIDDDGRVDFASMNERSAIRSIALNRLLLATRQRLLPVLAHVHNLNGGRGLGLLKLVNQFNLKPGKYQSSLDQGFRKQLVSFFDDEISKVETLIHRDLQAWRR